MSVVNEPLTIRAISSEIPSGFYPVADFTIAIPPPYFYGKILSMKKILFLIPFLYGIENQAQNAEIQAGPMLGYAEMKEAVVWVQTTESAEIWAVYDDLSTPEIEAFETEKVQTVTHDGHTAKLYFTKVNAGKEYAYTLKINGKDFQKDYYKFKTAPNWEFRTDPPAFKMAMGSCAYINEGDYDRPGKAYGGDYQIFESILEKKPDAMLWLGDNIYLRPADWWTRTGFIGRYTHTRSLPQMQKLLASCNHFATWDDHDFGPNDATGSWVQKDLALEMFQKFWVNPTFGYSDLQGIMSGFVYIDLPFILMDNRFHRTENFEKGEKQIFGKAQSDRMIDLLKYSQAPFKIVAVGGQFLNTAQVYENHANYSEERNYILQRIEEEDIKGVIFVSGDRHHGEVSELELPNGNKIWEITTSPLTAGPASRVEETNENRVEGTLITQRNFAVLEVSGKFRARKVKFVFYDSDGQELQVFEIDSADVYGKK